MKKEDVFVRIDSEEKRVKVIKILTDAGERIWNNSNIFSCGVDYYLTFDGTEWYMSGFNSATHELSTNELQQLLINEFREKAEKQGFELVEKKRDVNISAVDWLVNEITLMKVDSNSLFLNPNEIKGLVQKAKEIEENQHRDTWDESRIENLGDDYLGKQVSFSDYFKKRFKR